jgi:hypothetical protein
MTDKIFSIFDIVKVLAILIIVTWLTSIFLHVPADQTLTNVVMIIIGFFYGSSTGSKKKDDALTEAKNGNPS